MLKILSVLAFLCLVQISLQTGYIKVEWSGNEAFLLTGRSLELNVATVNLMLTCSYPPEYVVWSHPTGDRINQSVDNSYLKISIFRLAESGDFTCNNTDTQESVKIELIATGSGLFEIDSDNNDIMLSNGHSVLEPLNSTRVLICLSSVNSPDAALWYFPNESMITNRLQFVNDVVPGIAVFHALPSIGVYQLRLNGYFSAQDSGRYQCVSNNSTMQVETQSVYILVNGTNYIRVDYAQNSIQLTTNNTLDVQVGTAGIQLSCSIANAIWVHPPSPYISMLSNNDSSLLELSLFTMREAGSYWCVGDDTVEIAINAIGSALIAISGNNSRALFGHEVLTHDDVTSEVLCLSSGNQIPSGAWYHPIRGQIDTPVSREDKAIKVAEYTSSGVYKLVIEGELSSEDEGVYSCRIIDGDDTMLSLTFGLYSQQEFITVSSYPDNFQVYNEQTISFPPNRESIVLSCPYHDMTIWQQPSISAGTLLPDGRLLIGELTTSTEGVYTCGTTNGSETTTSISLLQGSQQFELSIDGEVFNGTSLIVTPCQSPPRILCAISEDIHDTPIYWYRDFSRAVVSASVNSAVLDTSSLRAEDTGMYMCGTNVLGYSIEVDLEIKILEANYVELQNGSRNIALVDEQTIYLDLLTPAVFLTCRGSLPSWSSYPMSNNTHLINSTTLHIDMFSLQTEGEYQCVDKSGDLITIYIAANSNYNDVTVQTASPTDAYESDFIRIEHFHTWFDSPSENYPIIEYGTYGVKLSCSLEGYTTWMYPQNTSEICMVSEGLLIRSINTDTRGSYSCSNNDNTVSIVLTNVIKLEQRNSSQLITGYSSLDIPVFSPNVTLSCDSPSSTWLITLNNNSTIMFNSTDEEMQRINATTISVARGVITIGIFRSFETGYYTCDPGTTRQTTVYLQSSGLALFQNFSTSPTPITNNSIFLIPPSSTLSLTCIYGSIYSAEPSLSYNSLSNYTNPPTNCIQTELSLITSTFNINITAKHINFTESTSIKANTALNGNYACVINQDYSVSFIVYHQQTVIPRISFSRNSSPLYSNAIISYLNDIPDLLECRVNIIESTIPVDSVEWWLNGSIVTKDPVLNLSTLQPQSSHYECRVFSRFVNVSKRIRIQVIGVPYAPTDLFVSEIRSTNALIAWKPPVSPLAAIELYLIEYTELTLLSLVKETYIAISNSTSFTVSSLTPDTRYSLRVRARNAAGYGRFSFSVTFKTLPAAPAAPLNSSYSNLTNTSLVLAWIPPRESDGIIQSYQINVIGSKSYDTLFEETLNPIQVNSSIIQLIIDSLTPDTIYRITILSLNSMGYSTNATTLIVATEPGVLNVTSPVIWSTPLRGLESVLLLLEETSDRNAEIKYQLLFMVRVVIDYNTESLNIPRLINNNKRTARDTSLPQQVIQLSVIANISSENCVSFPNYLTVGGPRGINPCYYSQQQNNLTNFSENIQTNYNPKLEFNFKYGFILTAVSREEITYFSELSELISLLPEDSVEIELSLIYTSAGVGAGVILFLLIVLLICCVTCSVLTLSGTKRSKPISIRKDSQTLGLATIDTSFTIQKSSLSFFNPLVSLIEDPINTPEALSTFEERARITYLTESDFAVSIDGLGEHIRSLHANNNQAFSQEYNRLDERLRTDANSSQLNCHRHLNRFVDIFPYDDSRVVLTPIANFEHDYINASFIDGYSKERNYIATQAPLLETICDFWRLCWEYNITVITLLTDSVGGDKARNYRYWPDNLTTEISFGPFVIKLTDILIKKNFIRRALLVKNAQFPDECRKINQFHFTSWPDTSMPEISSLLQFHTIVSSFYKSQKQSGPLLVHCRSGAGPSSVFLFLDILHTQARAENRICIQKYINSLRTMRSKMLCSLEYYIFAHDVLHACLTCGNTCIETSSFAHYFKKLAEVDSRTHSTGYHTEFTTLDEISRSPNDYSHTVAQENPTKNRNTEYLPIDSRCVHLSQGIYINATLLNGFTRENAFIIAESPLDTTINCFWQLIFERRCSTVVMLCDLTHEQKEVCAKYWMDSGEPVTYGHLTVQLSNIIHPEHGAFTIHTFMLTSAKIKV